MRLKQCIYPIVAASAALFAANASAVQFSYLDSGYNQDIFTASIPTGWGPGFAWTSTGNMVLRGGNTLYEYSLTDNTIYNGTAVHGYTAHTVAGLSTGGYGMTNGTDGYFYANTTAGIQRIDSTTWTATTMAGTAGGYYGIAALSGGRIAHNDNYNIWVYDTNTNTDTLIYTANSFIDGIATTLTGEIFLADLGANRVHVINDTGALLNLFNVGHGPDGMAFGGGSAFVNNTDGTITRLDFAGSGYTGAVTETIIASGGTYGDLAAAGPDCSFYVSQWGNVNWDGGSSYDSTIVRISSNNGCGFDPGTGTTTVPEPETLGLVALGIGALGLGRRRKKQS